MFEKLSDKQFLNDDDSDKNADEDQRHFDLNLNLLL